MATCLSLTPHTQALCLLQVVTYHSTIFYSQIAQDSKCEAYKRCGSQSTGEAMPAQIPFKISLDDAAGDLQTLNDILDRDSHSSSPCGVCGRYGDSSKVTHAVTWLTAPAVLLLGFKRERVSCHFEPYAVLTRFFDAAIISVCVHEQHAPIQSTQVTVSCINDALLDFSLNRRRKAQSFLSFFFSVSSFFVSFLLYYCYCLRASDAPSLP